jgi:hypothetical protein
MLYSKKMLLLFFILLFAASVNAQSVEIRGEVFNGTEDSSLVKNIEISLLVYRGHQMVDDSSHVQKTNSKGVYRFRQLSEDSTLIYYPRVTFHDIVYYGNGVRVKNQQSKFQSNIVVYDTTSEKNNIFASMEHLFLSLENGRIVVKEIFLLNNRGKRTYMGVKAVTENKNYVLEFPLPSGFENLEILTAEAQNTSAIKNGVLFDTALFSPGTKQYSYQFQIPHKGKEWHYSRQIIFPTGGVNIFLSDPQLTIQGPGIKPMGDFNIKGKTYQHYSLQRLMPGMQLDLTVTNLPGKSVDIKWIILIFVIVFLVAGFGYTFLKK